MREVVNRGRLALLIAACVSAVLTGCLVPPREAVKESGWSRTNPESGPAGTAQPETKLIKPVIPPESGMSPGMVPADLQQEQSGGNFAGLPTPGQPTTGDGSGFPSPASGGETPGSPTFSPPGSGQERPQPLPLPVSAQESTEGLPPGSGMPPAANPQADQSASAASGSGQLLKPEPAPSEAPGATGKGGREWEDQRIRSAAAQLAKDTPNAKKGKLCYSAKNDEWWVLLYEDVGNAFEVKQYTWNRDTEKMEQFLVLKRIGKDRLEEHLTAREPGKACEVLDPFR